MNHADICALGNAFSGPIGNDYPGAKEQLDDAKGPGNFGNQSKVRWLSVPRHYPEGFSDATTIAINRGRPKAVQIAALAHELEHWNRSWPEAVMTGDAGQRDPKTSGGSACDAANHAAMNLASMSYIVKTANKLGGCETEEGRAAIADVAKNWDKNIDKAQAAFDAASGMGCVCGFSNGEPPAASTVAGSKPSCD